MPDKLGNTFKNTSLVSPLNAYLGQDGSRPWHPELSLDQTVRTTWAI